MESARFSIGIDLGTTNTAMAFAPLVGDRDAKSAVFPVPQRETPTTLAFSPTLPSFLYLPADTPAPPSAAAAGGTEWITGMLARKRAHEVPGRVAHSAKSWLCHHAVDREAPFLPWGSDEVPPARRISPVGASALILHVLRAAWNERFAGRGPDFAFDAQEITITVPASFDAAAQRLTLAAAAQAGYPATVRLLEEPQAAFYRWLEQHDCTADLWDRLPASADGCCHVLVVDVGGGTSDFSLFEVRRASDAPGAGPRIKRLAVGEHILLGGDNIDLALAHHVEPRLILGGATLSGAAWHDLVARCRDLKEQALSGQDEAAQTFTLSLPGRGASLITGTASAELARAEIEGIVLDGFFPPCTADARVRRSLGALKEWGLPYAADSRITHHLADFLRGRPPVDAVLFNGGSVGWDKVRARICQQIAGWQARGQPLVLANAEPHLAVARGAAYFGRLLHQRAERIEAGAARTIFLEMLSRPSKEGEAAGRSFVCILPRGAAPEETFEIEGLPLALRVNRPVRFQIYSSTRHDGCKAGDVIGAREDELHALPPLQTVAKLESRQKTAPGATLPITLSAKLNELGLLQVACRSASPGIRQSWPLEFDLRPHEHGETAAYPSNAPAAAGPERDTVANVPAAAPDATPDVLASACQSLEAAFAAPAGSRNKLTAARLLASLETSLGAAKSDWSGGLVRSLWSALDASASRCRQSVEHEEAWLILAGFLLRPGFGAAGDDARIDRLWEFRAAGPCFPGKRIRMQDYILWRRVAGGLSRERQEAVLSGDLGRLRQPKAAPPELIRLAGSLERLGHDIKAELIERFVAAAAELARGGGHATPYLAALGMLLNRAPFYAGPEAVVPPELVERAYGALRKLDWSGPDATELQTLFLRAARVIDNRSLDVAAPLRQRIAEKLEKAGVPALKTAKLRAFMPVAASERQSLFGEQLPPGLILTGG